jgi:hypothetical protein
VKDKVKEKVGEWFMERRRLFGHPRSVEDCFDSAKRLDN